MNVLHGLIESCMVELPSSKAFLLTGFGLEGTDR